MEDEQLAAVISLGQAVAQHMVAVDKSLFARLLQARRRGEVVAALLRAQHRQAQQRGTSMAEVRLVTAAFEQDWQLARDLVLWQVVVELVAAGWFEGQELMGRVEELVSEGE